MLKYRLRKLSRKKTIVWTTILLLFVISMASIVRYYAEASFSGVDLSAPHSYTDSTVFINDIQSDYDYYMGLNYTEITSKTTLPGNTSLNKYTDDTLVAVQLVYDGTDINDSSIKGTVSSATVETQYIFKYYKYFPINSDGTVTIELIDNPFSNRPTGKGFNGWVCNATESDTGLCNSSIFSYDDEYYTRSITVSANGGDSITLYLNASWTAADIETDINDFNDKSMQQITTTEQDVYVRYQTFVVEYEYSFRNDLNGYYFIGNMKNQSFDNSHRVTATATNRRMNNSSGGSQILWAIEGTDDYTYAGSGTSCPNNRVCVWYDQINTNNTQYNPDYNYAFYRSNNGEIVFINHHNISQYMNSSANPIGYSWASEEPVSVGKVTDSMPFTDGTSYFYKTNGVSATLAASGLYYDYTGQLCSGTGCSGSTLNDSGYKLIQYSDAVRTIPEHAYRDVDLTPYNNYVPIDSSVLDGIDNANTLTAEQIALLLEHEGEVRSVGCYIADEEVPCKIDTEDYYNQMHNYYYLVTRDTNIYHGNINNNTIQVPMTMEGGTFSNGIIRDDFGMTGTTLSSNLNANNSNVKIGRNINTSGRTLYGGYNNGDNNKFIVETGSYYEIRSVNGNNGSNLNGIYVYGSDYDRAKSDNAKMTVTYQINASKSGNATNTGLKPSSAMYVKSGRYGTSVTSNVNSGNINNEAFYTYGIYTGALNQGSNSAFRTLTIEGGEIFSINGGPCIQTNYNGNVIGVYMKGGTVVSIVGGAGVSQTYGNRIISITGGQVTNQIAGGSNSSQSGGSNPGPMSGNTLVYVGGHAILGNGASISNNYNTWYTRKWYGVNDSGSVFGAGLGLSGDTNRGVVNNSHVIINGGTIYGNVYGGGNYGVTGSKITTTSYATVDLLGGEIRGSVYGAGNSAGGGNASTGNGTRVLSEVYYGDINFTTTNSIIPRNSYNPNGVKITNNATRCNSSYPGYFYYYGTGYCMYASTRYEIGDTYSDRITYYTTQDGEFVSTTPNTNLINGTYDKHIITINLNGSVVRNSVYGGSNETGDVYGNVFVNLYKGEVNGSTSGVYGGGRGQTTYIYGDTTVISSTDDNSVLKVNNVYGGSALGTVNNSGETSIVLDGGTFQYVYGGGEGDTDVAPQNLGAITVEFKNGTALEVYNGNNVNGRPNGPLSITMSGGTVGDVFGGSKGQKASTSETHVYVTGGTVNNVYGGGNAAPTITSSHVTIGQATGSTLTITGYTGDTNTDGEPIYGGVYGSGKGSTAYVPSTLVDVGTASFTVKNDLSDGASIYGGGYKAGTDSGAGTSGTSVVNVNTGATIYNAFGGSNQEGIVNDATVNVNNGTFSGNLYGGGNVATTNTTHLNLIGGSPTSLVTEDIANAKFGNGFGGGKSADVTNSNVELKGATLNNVYGGSNQNGLVSSSDVLVSYGTVTNAFGGNNAGGSTLNASVTVNKDDSKTLNLTNVYGGSNGSGAYIGARSRELNPTIFGSTVVYFKNGTISGDIFGGGNLAVVYGDTEVNMYDGTVNTIYGAGNMAHVGNYNTAYDTSSTPYTGEYNTHTAYVESERTSTVNIAGGTIRGNVFGSGNAAFIHGDTYVNIGKKALDNLSDATAKNIYIAGTVFGGSYTIASEETSYDFNSIGVVGHTHVNLDSTNYYSSNKSMITLRGSIYGEGNNSTITATGNVLSTIDVINYGNNDNPVSFASIARASRANVLDSCIELTGARNKQFIDDKSEYSFVTISNLYLLGTYNVSNPGGSTVYARGGGTYLYKMYSGYLTQSGQYVREELDDNYKPVGVDNRIYMPSRKVLVVNEGKVGVGIPGTVHGIAFLGMYKHSDDGIVRGIYDPSYTPPASGIVDDDTYEMFNPTSNFTYVYGSNKDDSNNDLEYVEEGGIRRTIVDGFFTNYADTEDKTFSTNYVGVTPKNSTYYKWIIGEEVLEIIVDLKASKYSMEASKNAEIAFEELNISDDIESNGDVVFKIGRIDTTEFGNAITNSTVDFTAELLDKTRIPKIAETYDENGVTDANRFFALSMGTSSSGWKSNYSTNIYTNSSDPYSGDLEYVYDSTNGPRNLSFWLYHSKNINTDIMLDQEGEIGLGHVDVDMVARNPNWGDATPDLTIVVTVNVFLTNDAEHDGYGYSIAPGKKYSTFASSTPTIGTDGSFSIYHSLSLDLTKPVAGKRDEYWSAERVYDDDNYRYLSSKDQLPTGTRITMIDMITGDYYFYQVTGSEPQNTNGTYSYYLTDFVSMSNVGGDTLYFDDDMNAENSKYYHEIGDNGKYAVEEFIFTFDFSSTNQNDYDANYEKTSNIYLELDGIDDDTGNIVTILTPVFETDDSAMNYTVLKAENSNIVTNGGFVKDDGTIADSEESFELYKQSPATLSLSTSLQNGTSNPRYVDTIYNDYQLGAKLTFYKIENGNRVALSYDTLDGLVVDINGDYYYPENSESYGIIRLNLAGRISSLESVMKLDFTNVTDSFVVGEYQLCVETFGSYDGLYYNGVDTSEKCFNFNLLSSEFGLLVNAPSSEVTHDVVTGLDSDGKDTITYTVQSTNGLAHPVMKIGIQSLKSHSGDVYTDVVYENKNICDFATRIEITGDDKETVTIDCTSEAASYYYDLGPISNDGLTEYTVTMVLKHGPNDSETNPMTSGWRSGTYRVMFTVFDRITTGGVSRDTSIGSDYEYLIIRSLDVDEFRNGG